jgi:hypothetical protein
MAYIFTKLLFVRSRQQTSFGFLRLKISQFVNKMCSHCLFPVVDKSGTSCYHLVTRLMRPTDSQQVVPTSLISSARNKLLTSWWQQARSNLLRTACISLVGTTCSKSVTVINLVPSCCDKSGTKLLSPCYNVDDANTLATSCYNKCIHVKTHK